MSMAKKATTWRKHVAWRRKPQEKRISNPKAPNGATAIIALDENEDIMKQQIKSEIAFIETT